MNQNRHGNNNRRSGGGGNNNGKSNEKKKNRTTLCAVLATLLFVFAVAASFFHGEMLAFLPNDNNNNSLVPETTRIKKIKPKGNNGTTQENQQYQQQERQKQQQQQRWQPFQVEIDEYIQLSAQRGHAGAITTTIDGGPSLLSSSQWEYPVLSEESLGRALWNRTMYIDGDSLSYYFAVLLLHCLDYVCENGLDGKNPRPPLTNVKSMLENNSNSNETLLLRSGYKEHYANLWQRVRGQKNAFRWSSGQKRFDQCFLRGRHNKGDENNATTNEEEETSASYVTVQYSFYYNQRDSAENSILLPSSSRSAAAAGTNNSSSNNNNTTTTDVAVVDFDVFHRLHLFPMMDGWNTEMVMGNLGPSLNFENQIETTVRLASNAGAKCVFLRTSNPICESKDNPRYRLVREFYRNLEELDRDDRRRDGNGASFNEEACQTRIDAWGSSISDVVKSSLGGLRKTDLCNTTRLRSKQIELEMRCVEAMSKQLPPSLEEEEEEEGTTTAATKNGSSSEKEFYYGNNNNDSDDNNVKILRELCSYRFSQINAGGVESRRDQMRQFALANQERYLREGNTKLIYFDWYKIVKDIVHPDGGDDDDNYCRYTDDSVHYGKLLPVQLKLITNVIARHC
mmetsp:Transcript_17495/g.18935  ORF Transcript_17495/g.18935 Transcript_17495/m.18935 type:complete len:624 (+) Transcript_17495:37-1908(+)